eukprot:CAMPEP_0205929306 /NCGR_PEP_ID=MMETSP1325-20131115/25239_1 /ASSEMBLY_ACC=CAM_ASM_000708 /TAXON_ID=236786 /ORGANISM="Florenciella sp., Strain RCC1007" /LENGTH=51 /DNA_ID=CAMNT_0053298505 /DNA_START=15 /DNA_END=167 /DNA_ORIENTATION=-
MHAPAPTPQDGCDETHHRNAAKLNKLCTADVLSPNLDLFGTHVSVDTRTEN